MKIMIRIAALLLVCGFVLIGCGDGGGGTTGIGEFDPSGDYKAGDPSEAKPPTVVLTPKTVTLTGVSMNDAQTQLILTFSDNLDAPGLTFGNIVMGSITGGTGMTITRNPANAQPAPQSSVVRSIWTLGITVNEGTTAAGASITWNPSIVAGATFNTATNIVTLQNAVGLTPVTFTTMTVKAKAEAMVNSWGTPKPVVTGGDSNPIITLTTGFAFTSVTSLNETLVSGMKVVVGGNVTVPADVKLTFPTGSILEFADGADLNITGGEVVLQDPAVGAIAKDSTGGTITVGANGTLGIATDAVLTNLAAGGIAVNGGALNVGTVPLVKKAGSTAGSATFIFEDANGAIKVSPTDTSTSAGIVLTLKGDAVASGLNDAGATAAQGIKGMTLTVGEGSTNAPGTLIVAGGANVTTTTLEIATGSSIVLAGGAVGFGTLKFQATGSLKNDGGTITITNQGIVDVTAVGGTPAGSNMATQYQGTATSTLTDNTSTNKTEQKKMLWLVSISPPN